MLKLKLQSILRADFLRDEDGAIAIEAMIILPVLFWAYMSVFSVFDAYRQYSLHQKAAYTISDALSRETMPINGAYLDGSLALFDALTRDPQDSSIRISVVHFNDTEQKIKLDWSQTRGSMSPLIEADISDRLDMLPTLLDGERMILVETHANYDPPFRTGLEDRTIENFIFTRPRYAPQLLWEN